MIKLMVYNTLQLNDASSFDVYKALNDVIDSDTNDVRYLIMKGAAPPKCVLISWEAYASLVNRREREEARGDQSLEQRVDILEKKMKFDPHVAAEFPNHVHDVKGGRTSRPRQKDYLD